MSSLAFKEKEALERLFQMGGGYVLDFSNRTFGEFFEDMGVNIWSPRYQTEGTSKARVLRAFWKLDPDAIVGKSIVALIEHHRQCHNPGEKEVQLQALIKQCRDAANRLLETPSGLDGLKAAVVVFDAKYMEQQIQRMEKSMTEDPALAIGTAKELIETCCKTILEQQGEPVKDSPDVPELVKRACGKLELVPKGIANESGGSQAMKVLLGNLTTVARTIGEIRNLYGTGHGKHADATGLTPRHARLVVGATSALVHFLFETHKETKP